ncbi:MAG: 1-acyl-sn-glycerol-3-phosphate acyltransferase [Kordiimonadaceae bacterium]|nr:1-acyl-sn-glycerol-3-phosphate acyltransferase [Kordiimonadaceae bacterium]
MPTCPKYVALAGPHTSNWDFPVFMSVVGVYKMRVSFLGKASLFAGPMGRMFYYLGGIPVERQSATRGDVVQQVVKIFEEKERLILGIAPEGTRSKVDGWKTGFYRIALEAGVPVQLAFIDARRKEVGFGPLVHLTGDMEGDVKEMQAFYSSKQGIIPQNQ